MIRHDEDELRELLKPVEQPNDGIDIKEILRRNKELFEVSAPKKKIKIFFIFLHLLMCSESFSFIKGGGSDTFAYIWLSGFILRLTVKIIMKMAVFRRERRFQPPKPTNTSV